jgi:aryl-alcohol dehydrogenase-like predicted oxidoreductase
LIHWPNWDVPLSETVEALKTLQSQGKIREIGVCNFGVKDMAEMLELYPIATNQLPYNLLWRVVEQEILPACRAKDVGLMCYSPLAQGLLTGRYASAAEVPDGLARTRHYSSSRAHANHGEAGTEAEVFAALSEIQRIAEGMDRPMAEVALAWLQQQAGVATILVGARSPEELQWNLPALDLQLAPAVIEELNRVTEPVKQKLGNNPDMWLAPSRMQ